MILKTKLEISKLLCKRAIKEFGNDHIAIASSGGKDSMLITEIYKRALKEESPYQKPIIVHADTKIQPKGTVEFLKENSECNNCDLSICNPLISYGKCVKKYGLPGIRNIDSKSHNEPYCCKYLKNLPADNLYKEMNIKCIIIGLTKSESHNRRMYLGRCGDYYHAKIKDRTQVYPIAEYSLNEVWLAHDLYNIEIHPFYSEFPTHRLGCLPCTSYIDWKSNMPLESPKWYKWTINYINKMKGI